MNLNHIEMGRVLSKFVFFQFLYSLGFSVPEMMIKRITYQVLNAVDFCHRHNVRIFNRGKLNIVVVFFRSVFIVVSTMERVKMFCILFVFFRCETGKYSYYETEYC